MENEKVYGYKGINADMTCRGMKFAVGNKYHVDGDIDVCKNGLHFCKRLIDVFDHYPRDENRFFLIAAYGEIKTEYAKSVASDIEILRELNDIEINRNVYGNGNGDGYGDGDVNGYGNGDGYGNGYGDGEGYGYGDGNGDGYGYGYGNGYGYVDVDGNGYGDGDVNGAGDGNGNGDGNGYGDGNGDGIQRILLFV